MEWNESKYYVHRSEIQYWKLFFLPQAFLNLSFATTGNKYKTFSIQNKNNYNFSLENNSQISFK